MRRQKNQDPKTAEVAYENAHLTAQNLIEQIGKLLSDMPAPGSDHLIHWGHVGDINHVNDILREAVKFLENEP